MTEPAPATKVEAPGVADPAPLGLAAFALTTFLLSAKNAGWTPDNYAAWLGYALAYGGVVQLLAGMWEFRNKNVFGATAFSSYGGFWIGLGLYVELVGTKDAAQTSTALGWILLAFAIFNTYMLIASTKVNGAVFGVFVTLEVTLILLFVAEFAGIKTIGTFGGYVGILTALVAWYASFAGVMNGVSGRTVIPVGGPLLKN